MPIQSRIDAPGTLYHVICRGTEWRTIYRNSADRNDFAARLGKVVSETKTSIYAWALMLNHFLRYPKPQHKEGSFSQISPFIETDPEFYTGSQAHMLSAKHVKFRQAGTGFFKLIKRYKILI